MTDRIPYIYANTITGSPLRDFTISIVVKRMRLVPTSFMEQYTDRWCKDSLLDLTKLLVLRLEQVSWKDVVTAACDWHVHEEGVKCKK
jgi:hypothetical protein